MIVNNRMRRELGGAISALRLVSPDRSVRLAAAQDLAADADPLALPAIRTALATERDPEIRASLTLTRAGIKLASGDRDGRLGAVRASPTATKRRRAYCCRASSRKRTAASSSRIAAVRAEAEQSLRAVDARLARGEFTERIFSGVSLGRSCCSRPSGWRSPSV